MQKDKRNDHRCCDDGERHNLIAEEDLLSLLIRDVVDQVNTSQYIQHEICIVQLADAYHLERSWPDNRSFKVELEVLEQQTKFWYTMDVLSLNLIPEAIGWKNICIKYLHPCLLQEISQRCTDKTLAQQVNSEVQCR